MVKRSDILYTNNIQLYLISNSKKSKVKIKIIRQTSIRSFETSSKTRSFDQSNPPRSSPQSGNLLKGRSSRVSCRLKRRWKRAGAKRKKETKEWK